MANDFLLVGPTADPAKIRGRESIAGAFEAVAKQQSLFVSRADDSGTHHKEKEIWAQLKTRPEGDWYIRAGTGMAAALLMADQKHAYILTDRATFLTRRTELELVPISEGDALLKNHYHVMVVDPAKHPGVHSREARRFADFLTGAEGRARISRFGRERFGQALFLPEP
jgi:tungstate transport system substrate-binding protein